MRGSRTGSAVILALVLLAAGCKSSAPTAARAKLKPNLPAIEQYFKYTSISDIYLSSSKAILTASREDGSDIYAVFFHGPTLKGIDCPGTTCRALGFAHNSFLYSRTENGASRIYAQDLKSRDIVELPGQDGTADKFFVRRNLCRFFTTGNGRDEHVLDLYEWDEATLKHRLAYKNDLKRPFFIGPLSHDGGTVALTRSRGDRGDELRIRDLHANRDDAVPVREGDMVEPLFFLDGTLYYLAYDGEDRRGIMRFKPGDREPERFLFDPFADFRLATVSTDDEWKRILTVKSRDGGDELELYDPRAKRTVMEFPIKGQISWADFDIDDKLIVYLMGTETSPAALFIQRWDTKEKQIYGAGLKLDTRLLAVATPQTIPARDGLSLPAFLYRPTGNDHRPAVIWLHGGPGGEFRREYDPFIQSLVSRGYIVLALNYRGSSGYGRSYGGYLALAALARAPEKFAAGVDLFGPSNWVTALADLPPEALVYLPALYAEIGDPVADRDELLAISPVSFADRIRGPLLIIQGGMDSKVAGKDTTELVRRIRSHLGWVEYVYFRTEGHGFEHVGNEILCARRVLEFLDRHLKGIKPAAPAASGPPVFAH